MRSLKNRVKRLEDKIDEPIQKKSPQFTMEMVEAWKILCLNFQKHFGILRSIDLNGEPDTEDIQIRGRFWVKNLAAVYALLVCRPEILEKVEAVPKLAELASLIAKLKN
jgi:hypothetical protein